VALLLGFGGHSVRGDQVAAAAAATPDWTWEVTGVTEVEGPANVIVHPPDGDVWALLNRAGVVVASASGNAVAEVAAARRPLICLAQERPFGEQRVQAAALSSANLATAVDGWPAADRWPELLARAQRYDPTAWAKLHDGGAAQRFAAALRRLTAACG
jgi:UDP-N-acetylglucosamine:LPS N-acetylglucosamine transferase